MKYKDLKSKTDKDLNLLLAEKRENLRALKFSVGLQQEKNVRNLRKVSKEISQILTELNFRRNSKKNDAASLKEKTVIEKSELDSKNNKTNK